MLNLADYFSLVKDSLADYNAFKSAIRSHSFVLFTVTVKLMEDRYRPIVTSSGGSLMVNRKLIRPSLSEIKDQMPRYGPVPRKRVPPEVTNAENYYYIKQMAAKTPMIVKLTDGEEIRGVIEWYDKNCIKVHRNDGPNLLILKHVIKYMYKQNEDQEPDEVDLE
jgi:host factor-I protein